MRLQFVIIIFIILSSTLVSAQSGTKLKNKYRVWITTYNDPFFYEGTLHSLKDSSVVLNSVVLLDSLEQSSAKIELPISEIVVIEARRKNRVGYGGVIGAFTGLAVGGILGFASGDDKNGGLTASEKAALGGVTLAIPGALVGVLVGSSKIIIPINRSAAKYKGARLQLSTLSTKR